MNNYVFGFMVGWGTCMLYFTAIAAFRPHWLGIQRREQR